MATTPCIASTRESTTRAAAAAGSGGPLGPGHKGGHPGGARILLPLGLLLTAACVLAVQLRYMAGRMGSDAAGASGQERALDDNRTLVIYVFSGHEGQALSNLEYFVRDGMHEADGNTYAIIVQGSAGTQSLPRLPSNARYVSHANECYDWGSIGWLLRSGLYSLASFRHFILLNSSVRGPFMPVYLRGRLPWTQALTGLLGSATRVAGGTINCGGNARLVVPHVQSYLLATDREMVQTLLHDPEGPFACRDDRDDTITHAELGFSARALRGGYALASLLKRYEGLAFTADNKAMHGCNAMQNPTTEDTLYDGTYVSAMEVMFVKIKDAFLRGGSEDAPEGREFATSALATQRWMEAADAAAAGAGGAAAAGHQLASTGTYRHLSGETAAAVAAMRARAGPAGAACFDGAFYVRQNGLPPAAEAAGAELLWEHFLYVGMPLDYEFRLTCQNSS